MVDVVVLGATGYTGKLVTRYLHVHRERDSFSFAIAGRSKAKLAELVSDLSLDSSVPVFEFDVTKADQVDEVVQKARVVINTVGPFYRWGKPVVKACAHRGVHYVDITGESAFVRDIIQDYDYIATKNHAIIVPSCGFDSMPSDITAYLSAKTIREVTQGAASVAESHTMYRIKGGVSGGTASTAISSFEEVPRARLRAARASYSLSPVKGIKLPGSRLVYSLPYVTPTKYGFPFPLAPHNVATVQRTWGLYQLRALSSLKLPETTISYGDTFKYSESIGASGPIKAFVMGLAFTLGGMCLLFIPPVRWLLKLFAPSPGQGPSDESLASGFLKGRNVSVSTPLPETKQPIVVETTLSGKGDPGYALTAVMLSEAALCLLNPSKLTPLAQEGGILTPMSAFADVLIKRLKASERFEFETEVLTNA